MSRVTRSQKAGLPPGSLVYTGKKKADKVILDIIDYTATSLSERRTTDVAVCRQYKDSPSTTWINVTGIHDPSVIEEIGKVLDIHPLVLEDILTTGQRPKMENFDTYLFFIINMLFYDTKKRKVSAEQVSLIVSKKVVISFQETPGDVFDPVRLRIRNKKGPIRRSGTDYLAHALLDAVIDQYFVILESIGEEIEELEEQIALDPAPERFKEVHRLKQVLINLRRSVWPLREVINTLVRGESRLITRDTIVYLRDLYDHTIQVIDAVETFRDMVASLLEMYMSSISNKLNETMKVLTIISTIFIPLSFITGVYGMNFQFMPEIEWKYGYLFAWGIIICIMLVMLIYFKKKGWF